MMIGDLDAGTIDAVMANGYATVAVLLKYSGNSLAYLKYIGER